MDYYNNQIPNTKENLKARLPWRQIFIAGVILFCVVWWTYTPDGLLGKADAIGYAVCHRIETRSFHIGTRQIPLCARCTGQYLGAIFGLIYLSILHPKRSGYPSTTVLGILIVFVIAYAVDGINSFIHLIPGLSRFYLYEPSNFFRLVTGTGLGLGISLILYPAFNDAVLKNRIQLPAIKGVWELFLILVLVLGVDLLVLTNNPLILYPLALISAFGVIAILTLVYTMVIVLVLRFENHFDSVSRMLYLFIGGFMIAIIQISILDYLRFLITGTWSGFHFG